MQFINKGYIDGLLKKNSKIQSKINMLNWYKKEIQMFLDNEESGIILKKFEEFNKDYKINSDI